MLKVWLWEELETWERPLWELMRDMLSPRVVRRFRKAPPEYVVGDDLSWLDDIVCEVSGERRDTKSMLAERIQVQFDAIRAYHATRTDNVASFYRRGLTPLDASAFEERARAIFLTPEFPELTEAGLKAAVASVGRTLRHGSLFFDVHRRELLEWGSHYMLYGSEYLTAIAANIEGPRDYRQVLKRFGVPTIFVCDVPLILMHQAAIADYAGHALRIMFERVLDPAYVHPEPGSGGGICVKASLPPTNIVGHTHPAELRDPFLGYKLIKSPMSSHSADKTKVD